MHPQAIEWQWMPSSCAGLALQACPHPDEGDPVLVEGQDRQAILTLMLLGLVVVDHRPPLMAWTPGLKRALKERRAARGG
jgi:hypothetical protein